MAAIFSRPKKAHAVTDDTPLDPLENLKRLSSKKALIEETGAEVILSDTKDILQNLEQDEPKDKLSAAQQGLAIASNLGGFWKYEASEKLLLMLEKYVDQIDDSSNEKQLALIKIRQKYTQVCILQDQFERAIEYFENIIACADALDDAALPDKEELKLSCFVDIAMCYRTLNEENKVCETKEMEMNFKSCKTASEMALSLNSYMKIYDYHQQIIDNLDDRSSKLAGKIILEYLHNIIKEYKRFKVPRTYRAEVYAYFAQELDGHGQPERGNLYARTAMYLAKRDVEQEYRLKKDLVWLAYSKENFIDLLRDVAPSYKWNEDNVVEEEKWLKENEGLNYEGML